MATQVFLADKPTLDLTKTGVDNANTTLGTINTNVNTVKTQTDTLESSLGTNASASSATGDVHAKLKDIKNSIVGISDGYIVPKFDSIYQNSMATNSKITLVNVTGKGFIDEVRAISNTTLSGINNVKIELVVDGVTHTLNNNPSVTTNLIGSYNYSIALALSLKFNNSLIVRFYHDSVGTSANMSCGVTYGLY